MHKQRHLFTSLRRIESPITPGASDVEYVSSHVQGWIELKTCDNPRKGKQFYLHCSFTPAQGEWLMQHHAPERNLRSYMLLAVLGPRTWKEFLLLEPSCAMLLVAGWRGIPHEDLRKRKGVRTFGTMGEVAKVISEGTNVTSQSHKRLLTVLGEAS